MNWSIAPGRRGEADDVTTRLSDGATVLAIFPGNPYLVVTDAWPMTDRFSGWENPFLVEKREDAVADDPDILASSWNATASTGSEKGSPGGPSRRHRTGPS